MTEFTISRCRDLTMPALTAAALAAVLLCGGGPAVAEDAANPNVIVDDSALDGAAGTDAAGNELLPAPAHQPMSRLVTAGQSAVEAATPPETTNEATVSAVPTTPIESTSLDGAAEPAEATAAPAAGAAAEGESASENTAAAEESGPADEQTAAKPPIDGMLRLTFEQDSAILSDTAKARLEPLVQKLSTDYLLRVQVLAYAGGDEDASSHARGVSLARALAMRDYLATQGITLDRMDIKALGNTAQEEPADRVDLVPLAE